MTTGKGNTAYKTALATFSNYLATHEMRMTIVRQMVLNEMCQLPQPFTADQLEAVCRAERISRGTIYNTLSLLLKANVVHATKRQYGRTSVQYEITTGETSHMKVVCRLCGREAEFHDKAIGRLIQERKYYNFQLRSYTLIVYGECKICHWQKRKKDL